MQMKVKHYVTPNFGKTVIVTGTIQNGLTKGIGWQDVAQMQFGEKLINRIMTMGRD